jgi:SAM-dependent methyltransferase
MSGNAGLMLKTALAVLQAQGPAIETNPQQKRAYRTGIKFWQRHYGETLFQQALTLNTSGQHQQAWQKLITLLRLAPRYFFQRLYWQATQVGLTILSAVLPVPIRRLLVWCRGQVYHPPVGAAWLGDLRRLTPLSQEFGYDRGLPIDRYYIENFLAQWAADVRGRVLEVGDDSYTRRFGEGRTTIHDVLHVAEGNPVATVVADLTRADHIPTNTFECIILTQTLHLVYDVKTALQTLDRILKPGGVLLATVPGISQISIDEWADSWYWAFTELAIRRLFGEAFGEEQVIIKTHGNVLAATAFLNGLAAEELHQAELEHHDPHYQLLITIRAVKPR